MSGQIKHGPLTKILDRNLSIANARELIEKYSPYLRELVNYATNLLARCENASKGVKGYPISILSLYYHIIQMADAAEVLISNSCLMAGVPILRSIFEADISLEYILKDDFETRSTAWLIENIIIDKRYYESFDTSTEIGAKFKKDLSNDRFSNSYNFALNNSSRLRNKIESLDKFLKNKGNKTIYDAFSGKTKITRWFQINKGPRNIEALAKLLNRPVEYELFYRIYSSFSHAKNFNNILDLINNNVILIPIRGQIANGEMLCSLVGAYLVSSSKLIAGRFRPEEKVHMDLQEIAKRHRPEDFRNL